MRSAFGARFWEGVAWGLGAVTLLMGLLYASRSVSFVRAPPGPESLAFAGVWAATTLGVALFEQYSMRGYLQFTLGRGMGFWRAAVLVTVLFSIEDLLSPSRRDVLRFAGSVAYGLFYCLTLLRTSSLFFAVGLHFAFGWGLVFLFGMPTPLSSPEPDGAILHPVMAGPGWLTGGKYGPEGSVLIPAVIALLALGVNRRFLRGRAEGRLGRDAGGGPLGDERIELGA